MTSRVAIEANFEQVDQQQFHRPSPPVPSLMSAVLNTLAMHNLPRVNEGIRMLFQIITKLRVIEFSERSGCEHGSKLFLNRGPNYDES